MAHMDVVGSADLSTKMRYISSFTFAENGGTPGPARVLIRDGAVTGPIVIDEQIAASTTVSRDFAKPIYCPLGVYVQVTTGTIRGSLRGY
jgi:hypothetical protein